MGQKTVLVGNNGFDSKQREADVDSFKTATGLHTGAVVKTHDYVQKDIGTETFINDTVGANMAIDASFSGTPEIITNGLTSVEWNLTGDATWTHSGGKLNLTNGNNNDIAILSEENALTVDWDNFVALTGVVDLGTWLEANHDITFQFDLAGTPVGDPVSLNTFIDPGNFSAQSFSIPKSFFNFTTTEVDGLTITCQRSGGSKPSLTLDDLQMEQSGSTTVFKINAEVGNRFHIQEIRWSFIDVYTGVLTDSSVPRLSHNQILALPELTNGIILTRVHHGKVDLSASLRSLSDFLTLGADVMNYVTDGTNSYLNLVVKLPTALIIDGTEPPSDNYVSLTISDDLSGLTRFTAVARGAYEVLEELDG